MAVAAGCVRSWVSLTFYFLIKMEFFNDSGFPLEDGSVVQFVLDTASVCVILNFVYHSLSHCLPFIMSIIMDLLGCHVGICPFIYVFVCLFFNLLQSLLLPLS